MRRSQSRELLMQMLFEMEIQKDFSVEKKEKFLKNNLIELDKDTYFNNSYEAVVENKDEIDKMISTHSKNWSIDTMAKVDLSILRLSIAELFFSKATPASVAINEAVELGKKFGGDNSGRFINGILGTMVKEKSEQ